MERITLNDPQLCGKSIAEQMNDNGVSIGCAHVRNGKNNIYQLFRTQLKGVYESVGQGTYSKKRSGECGLCGHLGLSEYYTVKNTSGKLAITQHPAEGIEFVWPDKFDMGSSCIKLLDIPYIKNKMFDSMFVPGTHFAYTLTPNGMIHTGNYLIRHYNDWVTNVILIPHSLFTVLPDRVIRAIGAEIYLIANPAIPGKCSEIALLRSFYSESPKAKYKILDRFTDRFISNGLCGTDKNYDCFVTMMTKAQAKLLLDLYRQHKI